MCMQRERKRVCRPDRTKEQWRKEKQGKGETGIEGSKDEGKERQAGRARERHTKLPGLLLLFSFWFQHCRVPTYSSPLDPLYEMPLNFLFPYL